MTSLPARILAALICLASLGPAAAAARHDEVLADLQMAADSERFRRTAETFVAHAMAGDASAVQAMLSRTLLQRSGEGAIRRVLDAQILPFFAQGRGPGRSTTITRTTDAAGQAGFAFYMWLMRAEGGEPRPFTVYVVQEQGSLVVANVVPDRLVEGRHR
ncbi:MAG TPA: hypothetical protein VJN44_17145 [Roseateles sp.]|nr:hypothetical protein [Roseateles sp.]